MERLEIGLVLRTFELYPKFTILFGWDVGPLAKFVTTPTPTPITDRIPEEVFECPHKYLDQVVAKTSISVNSGSELGQFLLSAKVQPTAWATESIELQLLHICEGAFRRGKLGYMPPNDRDLKESLARMYKLHPWMTERSFGHLSRRTTMQSQKLRNLFGDLTMLRKACYEMGRKNSVAPILPVIPLWRTQH